MLATQPEKVVEMAVRGMLPKNKLGAQMYKNLMFMLAQNIHMLLRNQKFWN